MIVIPAVDIRNGNSVRLKQGKVEFETIHSTDPVFTAKLWKAKGAKRLHVVDLDGAISETNQNSKIIKEICESVKIPVEFGGGIRSMERLKEVFKMGVSFAVLGTAAVYNPLIVKNAVSKYGADKIIAAVDVKDGKIAVGGWKEISHIDADEFIDSLKEFGIEEIIYTNIARDGMLNGPDFDGLEKILKKNIKVISSGGIKSVDDLLKLKQYEKDGLTGAIVGSALYTDSFNLEEAVKIVE